MASMLSPVLKFYQYSPGQTAAWHFQQRIVEEGSALEAAITMSTGCYGIHIIAHLMIIPQLETAITAGARQVQSFRVHFLTNFIMVLSDHWPNKTHYLIIPLFLKSTNLSVYL